MKYLVKLSVQGNRIRTVDLGSFQWYMLSLWLRPWLSIALTYIFSISVYSFPVVRPRLQMMNASRNRLEEMTGLETMSSLISLNLGKILSWHPV
jgi:hypothetical protein